jgi:hypothetical protein
MCVLRRSSTCLGDKINKKGKKNYRLSFCDFFFFTMVSSGSRCFRALTNNKDCRFCFCFLSLWTLHNLGFDQKLFWCRTLMSQLKLLLETHARTLVHTTHRQSRKSKGGIVGGRGLSTCVRLRIILSREWKTFFFGWGWTWHEWGVRVGGGGEGWERERRKKTPKKKLKIFWFLSFASSHNPTPKVPLNKMSSKDDLE